jgi:hypothetical protein
MHLLSEEKMTYSNQHNLVRCKCCDALYDKTVRWARGSYVGTSNAFLTSFNVRENHCPVCGEENEPSTSKP